jgi:DNA-binding response OmpR family regulator
MKVLVVDDNEGIQLFLQGYFVSKDYEVLLADNGDTAVEIALNETPDLIFLDYIIPGLNGVHVVKALGFACKNTKTVIMSGHPIAPIKKQLKDYKNVVGYLAKPFDYTELKTLASKIYPDNEPAEK